MKKLILALALTAFIASRQVYAAPVINNSTSEAKAEPVAEVVQPSITSEAPTPIPVPVVETEQQPITGCEQYRSILSQYDWNVNVAIQIMDAESKCRSGAVNDNPQTGDYSIGLFQINLFGANARTRPSEEALKDPATNIQWAYKLYSGNNKSFIGQWGVCRDKVACY